MAKKAPKVNRQQLLKLLNKLGLETNKKQDEFILSDARFKIFRAGRRVGKSFTAAKDVLGDIMMPNTRGWIVGPNYELAEKEFRYILEFMLLAHKVLKIPKPEKIRNNAKSGELYISWQGSEVFGKSADKANTSLVGEELDWVIMSECAMHKSETWFRYVRPTLASRGGRAILPGTPDSAGIWLYDLELASVNNEEWAVFNHPAWECDHYDPKELESAKKELPEDAYYEQYGGEWRFYTGRVYKVFNVDTHCIESFNIPKSWKVRQGIDFGVRDATAVMTLAESPYGDYYLIDEYYQNDKPTQVHASAILKKERGRHITSRVADHHALGTQLILDWAQYGVSSVPCTNDRQARRDRFLTLLEPVKGRHPYHIREAGKPAGDFPRIFIFKDKCPNWIREALFLRWKEGSRREGSYGDTVGDDHAIDASEYVTHYATQGMHRGFGKRAKARYKPRFVDSITGY